VPASEAEALAAFSSCSRASRGRGESAQAAWSRACARGLSVGSPWSSSRCQVARADRFMQELWKREQEQSYATRHTQGTPTHPAYAEREREGSTCTVRVVSVKKNVWVLSRRQQARRAWRRAGQRRRVKSKEEMATSFCLPVKSRNIRCDHWSSARAPHERDSAQPRNSEPPPCQGIASRLPATHLHPLRGASTYE
jgi:hypothetical protein